MENSIKTREYFVSKMDSERKRIARFENALNEMETSNEKGIRMGKIHLANLYLNCIKLTYSIEKRYDKMFPDFVKFLEYYKDVCTSNDSMYDILDMLAIGILLQDRKKQFIGYLKEIVLKYDSSDGMICLFWDYLQEKPLQKVMSKISYFNKLLENEDSENVLKEELALWYEQHSDAYWYDSHKSSQNIFCGYWCFEVAALSKIFDIDDTVFYEYQFYPYNKYKE